MYIINIKEVYIKYIVTFMFDDKFKKIIADSLILISITL
jgi:hypothetical protein